VPLLIGKWKKKEGRKNTVFCLALRKGERRERVEEKRVFKKKRKESTGNLFPPRSIGKRKKGKEKKEKGKEKKGRGNALPSSFRSREGGEKEGKACLSLYIAKKKGGKRGEPKERGALQFHLPREGKEGGFAS